MTLEQLRAKFGCQLEGAYELQEWQTFFYWLVEDRLGLDRFGFSVNRQLQIGSNDQQYFSQALSRLVKHEPIQYILGYTAFYGLRIGVNRHTLIPRPETEELVQWACADLRHAQVSVLDLGTGSGCIALALAKELKQARVSGMDLSEGALRQARKNATALGLKVDFFKGDMLIDPLLETYDVMVSNPPYVREKEKPLMRPNVLSYEPDSALYVADDDPLLYYRRLAQLARSFLNPGGVMYVEINEYLGEATLQLFKEQGFRRLEMRKDLFGKDRMIKAIQGL